MDIDFILNNTKTDQMLDILMSIEDPGNRLSVVTVLFITTLIAENQDINTGVRVLRKMWKLRELYTEI
jgi:hypothetical protein